MRVGLRRSTEEAETPKGGRKLDDPTRGLIQGCVSCPACADAKLVYFTYCQASTESATRLQDASFGRSLAGACALGASAFPWPPG